MAFQKRIDNLEKKFYLTIEGYKNAYIQKARENTSESNNIFNQAEGRLNNVFSDLIQLKAEIHNTISANKESIAQGNVQITEAKNSWDKSKKELEKEYSTNLASNQKAEERIHKVASLKSFYLPDRRKIILKGR